MQYRLKIDIEFHATAEKVIVKSKATGFLDEIPNVLLLDNASKTLYALGRTEAEIKHESPDVWAKRPTTLQFYPIYDVLNFNSLFLEAALRFYTHAIESEVSSPMRHLFWGRWFDQFQYRLWLESYETVPEAQRRHFEESVYHNERHRVERVIINQRLIQRRSRFFTYAKNIIHCQVKEL